MSHPWWGRDEQILWRSADRKFAECTCFTSHSASRWRLRRGGPGYRRVPWRGFAWVRGLRKARGPLAHRGFKLIPPPRRVMSIGHGYIGFMPACAGSLHRLSDGARAGAAPSYAIGVPYPPIGMSPDEALDISRASSSASTCPSRLSSRASQTRRAQLGSSPGTCAQDRVGGTAGGLAEHLAPAPAIRGASSL